MPVRGRKRAPAKLPDMRKGKVGQAKHGLASCAQVAHNRAVRRGTYIEAVQSRCIGILTAVNTKRSITIDYGGAASQPFKLPYRRRRTCPSRRSIVRPRTDQLMEEWRGGKGR